MTTRILVPPGIGDIYWVLVKLKSFLEKNNLSDPEITIVSRPDDLNLHLRSIPFLEMIPWIKIGDPQYVSNIDGLEDVWQEAYSGPGRSIFPGVMGYDYFISYNGCINSGGYLETADEYECDWRVPEVQAPENNMLVCFFPFFGTYAQHEQDFPIALIAESINRITAHTRWTPVFLGGEWESIVNPRRHELLAQVRNSLDWVGKTSIKETLQLMYGCPMIFGYHSGLPNLGAAYGTPAVLLWDDRFPDSTSYAVMPPYVRDRSYIPISTKYLTVDGLVECVIGLHK